MGASAFGTPFDSSLAGAPGIDPNNKFADYDLAGLQSLDPQNAPSPQGAASQGALEAPPSGGVDQGAIDEEPAMDMKSIFDQAGPEDRAHLVEQVTESYAPHGMSLEGAAENALMKGGPQAWADAAKFGVDLKPFADKLNPDGADKATGKAFGHIPTEGQSASGEAFKSQDQALGDYQGKVAKHRKNAADEAAAKKQAQREAISAFLIEAGLRTLASNRDDAAGAMAEGALGTMDARRSRQRQAKEDSIADAQRKRTERRQDEQDEAGRMRDARAAEQYEYDKTQREAEEAKTKRQGMESVTTDEGDVYYFDPLDPDAGKYVEDEQGTRIKAKDVGLSAAQIETTARQRRSAINSKVEKIKAMDEFEREAMYPETEGLKGQALVTKIIELAKSELQSQNPDNDQTVEYLDY